MLGEGFKMLDRMVREVLPKKGSQDLKESRPERASHVKSWERAFQEGKASAKVLRQECVWGVRDCCNNGGEIKCGMSVCGSSRGERRGCMPTPSQACPDGVRNGLDIASHSPGHAGLWFLALTSVSLWTASPMPYVLALDAHPRSQRPVLRTSS